jgi:hypothetical protein
VAWKPWAQIAGIGTEFAMVDLDGDGALELVASSARAPGTGDALTIYKLAADGSAKVLRRGSALSGGIAGIAAGDFDGDGQIDIAAAVRLPGSTRSDLWILD